MIRDIPTEERPMEKLMACGARSLSDSELLANVIRTGTRDRSAIELSQALVREYGGLKNLSCMSVNELTRNRGIGKTRACQLVAAFELGRRAKRPENVTGKRIGGSSELVEFFKYEFVDDEVERAIVVHLSSSGTIMSWQTISVGILNASLIHPREVFKQAVREAAMSIILLHNHPSGNSEPSAEDFLITRRLFETGQLLGIALLDHIIVAGDAHYSFRRAGRLPDSGGIK